MCCLCSALLYPVAASLETQFVTLPKRVPWCRQVASSQGTGSPSVRPPLACTLSATNHDAASSACGAARPLCSWAAGVATMCTRSAAAHHLPHYGMRGLLMPFPSSRPKCVPGTAFYRRILEFGEDSLLTSNPLTRNRAQAAVALSVQVVSSSMAQCTTGSLGVFLSSTTIHPRFRGSGRRPSGSCGRFSIASSSIKHSWLGPLVLNRDELRFDQAPIKIGRLQELIVMAIGDNLAVIDDNHTIHVHHR